MFYFKLTIYIANSNMVVAFAILWFVSCNGTRDVGQGGFTSTQKDEIVDYLSTILKHFSALNAAL